MRLGRVQQTGSRVRRGSEPWGYDSWHTTEDVDFTLYVFLSSRETARRMCRERQEKTA